VKIEIRRAPKPDQKPDAPTLTPEEIAALEVEKAQLLEAISPSRKRTKPIEPIADSFKETAQEVILEPAPEVIQPPEPVQPVLDATAATTERKALEAQLKELEQQITAAKQREKQAQHAAIIAQQQKAQAQGTQQLAPLKPLLERHLAEVSRIQAKWGPTLKDFARSMPSDSDPQIRRAIGEVYRAAAPLGQKLGDARATVESALRGLGLAMRSAHPHVHSQAKVLGDAALQINTLALEGEIKSLVQLRNELRPGYTVHAVTNDHIVAPSLAPRPHITSVDFGPSLTN
jgi:hypothetical protein